MLLLRFLVLALVVAVKISEGLLHSAICIEDGHLKSGERNQSENCRDVKVSPTDLDPVPDLTRPNEIRFLMLERRNISEIESDALSNFTSLKHLVINNNALTNTHFLEHLPASINWVKLTSNNISEIQSGDFAKFHNFETLYLNHNDIRELKANTLIGLKSLRTLNLGYNRVSIIEPGFFRDMENLESVYLDYNGISSLGDGVFAFLENIEHIYLRGNKLTVFNTNVFRNLPEKLTAIYLMNNPIIRLPKPVGTNNVCSPLELCISSKCKSASLCY